MGRDVLYSRLIERFSNNPADRRGIEGRLENESSALRVAAEKPPGRRAAHGEPGMDPRAHGRRQKHGALLITLAEDAQAPFRHIEVLKPQGRRFRPAKTAPEKERNHGLIAQRTRALFFVGCGKEFSRLFERKRPPARLAMDSQLLHGLDLRISLEIKLPQAPGGFCDALQCGKVRVDGGGGEPSFIRKLMH